MQVCTQTKTRYIVGVTKQCLCGWDIGGCVMCEKDVSGDTKGKWSLDPQFQSDLILYKAELES
jgi:hypothetical protein